MKATYPAAVALQLGRAGQRSLLGVFAPLLSHFFLLLVRRFPASLIQVLAWKAEAIRVQLRLCRAAG